MKSAPQTITELAQRLKGLLNGTTPGNWHASKGSVHSSRPTTVTKRTETSEMRYRTLPKEGRFDLAVCSDGLKPKAEDVNNARFIAAAHNDLPAILARLDFVENALRWIPVTEGGPPMAPDSKRSLAVEIWDVQYGQGRIEQAFYYEGGAWYLDNSDYDYIAHPTHYRYIYRPEAPAPQAP